MLLFNGVADLATVSVSPLGATFSALQLLFILSQQLLLPIEDKQRKRMTAEVVNHYPLCFCLKEQVC